MSTPITTIHKDDNAYPALLRTCSGAPATLYCEGNVELLTTPCVSVVGSRVMTAYGRLVLEKFVPFLAKSGLTVVSGLALGIDGEAHRLALGVGGGCIAVLGCGIDITYPENHRALRDAIIKKGGCVVTEYPAGTPPFKSNFPERNRIVAGLSEVTLVVEAGERSGSLITGRLANEFGRKLCVIPGDITRPQSAGILGLLNKGAQAVATPEEVVLLYKDVQATQICLDLRPALTGSLATLYDLVSCGVGTLEALLTESGLRLTELQSALTVLELDNYVYRNGQTWQRTS